MAFHPLERRPRRWIGGAAALGAVALLGAGALLWHSSRHAPGSVPAATTSGTTASPDTRQTSASPDATRVIDVVAVVNGIPAAGYREDTSPSNSNQVFGCTASPAAVTPGVYECGPAAASADVCWPSAPGTLLCLFTPWDERLYRVFYTDALTVADPPTRPQPFAVQLDDGTQCRLRNGGAWGGRDDGFYGAFSCYGKNLTVLGPPNGGPAVDRSHPLWTVKVGELGSGNAHFPAPKTHTVTTAWFAGS